MDWQMDKYDIFFFCNCKSTKQRTNKAGGVTEVSTENAQLITSAFLRNRGLIFLHPQSLIILTGRDNTDMISDKVI